jgi:selenocysteine-specific elongation factor
LKHRGRYRLHLGTAEVVAVLHLLYGPALRPGEIGMAQFLLSEPVVAVSGQPFVLREESPPATVAGGVILEPAPARRLRRRDRTGIAGLEKRDSSSEKERVASALAALRPGSWSSVDLAREARVASDEVPSVVALLREDGTLIELTLGTRRRMLVVADRVEEWEGRLRRALERLHRAKPRQSAIPRAHLLAAFRDLGDDAILEVLIDRLAGKGQVVIDRSSVALTTFTPKLSRAERAGKDVIEASLRAGGYAPPDDNDLASRTDLKPSVLSDLMNLLVDEGRIVAIAPGLHMDAGFEANLRSRVREFLSDGRTLTVAQLRDLIGTTRKYAVPFSEHLDRIGLTRREGDVRVLAAPMKDVPNE